MVLEEVKTQSKRSQITIFFIFALLLVAAVIIIFLARDNFNIGGIPSNMEPVYNTFLTCLEEETLTGISILESQGGYIELPDFISGSSYMPFSSQLDFFGNAIPYWFYVSGNNLNKEQVPSKTSMEKQLADFVETELEKQGYEITKGNGKASVEIADNGIDATIDMPLTINRAGSTGRISTHKVQ